MPGLIAFRRRWSAGSDDFVVPSFMLFLLHVILFIIIAIILGTSEDLDKWGSIDIDHLKSGSTVNETILNKATCAHEIRNFSFGYLSLIAVAAILEILMTSYSMQGTILDPSARKPVEFMLYGRIAFGLLEMSFSIVSAVRITQHWEQCDVLRNVYNIQIGIVTVNIIVFFIVLLVGYCVFDPSGGHFYKVKHAYDNSFSSSRIERMRNELEEKGQQTWLSRLSNCFCCVSNNSANIKQIALDEISTLLNKFFKDYDLVMSDIIAGLTLLRHKQQCIENDTTMSECWCRNNQNDSNNVQEYMCGRQITTETEFVDLRNQSTRKEYDDMTYYCAYGLAAYGPLLYSLENSATGLCGLLHECLCVENPTCTSSCCRGNPLNRRRKTVIRGPSSCGWALAGVRKSLVEHGLHSEVVYLSLENELYQQPFFVSVDHEKKAVVVTVRGTLGEADALTDLVASPELIPCEDNDGTWKAHKGMVQGASYIKKKLIRDDMVLSLGFGHDLARGTRHYDLVLVGHSLGAGVASILALLLRPIYPNLKCYAFSPPGGLMSRSAMLTSQSVVRTLIFGKDLVPRLGIQQLENLRSHVIELLKHTDLPKYRIILGNLCGPLEHRHKLLRAERLSSRALRLASRRVISVTNETTTTEMVSPLSEELFPPGKIYHLVYSSEHTTGCRSKGKRSKRYYLLQTDNTLDFQEIIVSHKMILHHLPHEVLKAMKKARETSISDRISRSYAESATLPFVENNPTRKNTSRSSTTNRLSQSTHAHTRVTIESPERDVDSNDPSHPFLNSNQNHFVDVIDEILSSSVNSSLTSLTNIRAPLARPDSFTLSIPAHSPTSPTQFTSPYDETEVKAVPESARSTSNMNASAASNQTIGNNSLHISDPQASSTPFLSNKNLQENGDQQGNVSSFLDDSGKSEKRHLVDLITSEKPE